MRRIILVLSLATMLATAFPSVVSASTTDGCLICPEPPPPPSDTTPPTVIDTMPDNGAKGVDRDRSIKAKFSEAMNQATLDGSTFTPFTLVRNGSTTPVEAVVSYDASTQTLTLNPSGRLAKRTSYTATIEGGGDGDNFAVKDLNGNELAADYVLSFKTGRR